MSFAYLVGYDWVWPEAVIRADTNNQSSSIAHRRLDKAEVDADRQFLEPKLIEICRTDHDHQLRLTISLDLLAAIAVELNQTHIFPVCWKREESGLVA